MNRRERMTPSTIMSTAWVMLACAVVCAAVYFETDKPSEQQSLKPGFIACITPNQLEKFHLAEPRQKIAALKHGNCIQTEYLDGNPFSALDDGRVRIYFPDDQYADLFVDLGAL